MPDEEHFRKLERMYASAPTNEYFRPILKIGDGAAEITIPVRRSFHHAAGAVHGSVYFKALDDAAFFAANSLVTDYFVLTVSFNVYLVRPISEGVMTARGTLVHRSRNLFLAESELVDQEGRVLARGSGSFMRSRMELTPAIGYA
jgi:uncharacterized protein (TIGR00369 family)